MAVTVVVLNADTDPPPSITFDSPRVVIGRGDGADVRLPDPSVSHRHASLRQRGSDYLVVDEGSTNGTFVGAVRLAPQSPRIVRDGDQIRVGRIELEIRIEAAAPVTQGPLATRELALGLVSAALAAQGEHLAVTVRAVTTKAEASPDAQPNETEATPPTPQELTLANLGREYVVGRGQGCDLVLDDPDCSRRHLGLTRRGNGLFVRDLGSKNGSSLNGKPLTAHRETLWPVDAELRLGATVLRYEDPLDSALEELESAADEPITGQPSKAASNSSRASSRASQADDASRGDGASTPPTPDAPTDLPATSWRSPTAPPKPRKPMDPALTDFLVGSLAVVVFVLSLLGLYWLIT